MREILTALVHDHPLEVLEWSLVAVLIQSYPISSPRWDDLSPTKLAISGIVAVKAGISLIAVLSQTAGQF